VEGELAGQLQISLGVVWRDIKSLFTAGQSLALTVTKSQQAQNRKHKKLVRHRTHSV